MLLWFYLVACVGFTAAGQAMFGQAQEVPVNSSEVRTAADFAVVEFNKANADDPFSYKIVNITSAKMQIVAGVKYFLGVELGRTGCKKSHTVDTEMWDFKMYPQELSCNFVVTEVPWEHERVLDHKKCHRCNDLD